MLKTILALTATAILLAAAPAFAWQHREHHPRMSCDWVKRPHHPPHKVCRPVRHW